LNSIRRIIVSTVLAIAPGLGAWAATPAPASNWQVVQRHVLGGSGGWDYLAFEPDSPRLYISHADRVVVLDVASGKQVGAIDGLSGVHGIAFAPALHRGFISNGKADSVSVFDPATRKVTQTIAVAGHNPDAILYDPHSRRVFTFNGRSNDTSVIDAATGKLLGHIPLPGKPEFAVSDGRGRIFDNIESTHQLAVIDPVAMHVVALWPLQGCEEPSGLAIDLAHQRLFSVCDNKVMAVTDATTGKPVARIPIGAGPDAVRYDAKRGLVFSSNGEDGTLTVVHQDDADHYRVLATVPTQTSARTMALDKNSGHVFVVAAKFGPAPKPTADHPRPRGEVLPGSFTVIELAPGGAR
jgi:YVTN family beta-propeller protein